MERNFHILKIYLSLMNEPSECKSHEFISLH